MPRAGMLRALLPYLPSRSAALHTEAARSGDGEHAGGSRGGRPSIIESYEGIDTENARAANEPARHRDARQKMEREGEGTHIPMGLLVGHLWGR